MENSYEFNVYGGSVDEVYGLSDYENIYYNAPQQPSYNWSDLYYCQTEPVYDPAFYVMPSYHVYYPEMPVLYSADYYYMTDAVPVYLCYYMPYYYQPTYLYYVSGISQVPAYGTTLMSSSVEQNSSAFEEYYCGLYSPDSGFYNDSDEKFEGVVGEATNTCHLFYAEGPENLNDDPNDDEGNSASSNSEAMCKEESSLEVIDSDYEDVIFELCREFEKLSLLDNEKKSSLSKPNDNRAKDSPSKSDDTSVEDSPSKSDDTSVEDSPSKLDDTSVEDSSSKSDENSVEDSSSKSDDNSSGDSSSSDSSSSDSYEVNDSAIERQGNIMDFHHIEDYSQSAFHTSPWSGDKKIITEENSEVESEVHQLSGQSDIDMIVSSEEYLFVQDNLEHPKRYKDYLYRKSLKNNPRREKNILFDILPTIEEESTPLMDDTPTESEDEIYIEDRMIVSDEMISSVEDEPVISKMKQPKRRFKAFKKWLSRTFCCCCTTKDPP